MKKEDFDNGLKELGILLNETVYPNLLKRDFYEELKEFDDIYIMFDCMQDEVNRVKVVTDFHDGLVEESWSMIGFLVNFLEFMNGRDCTDDEWNMIRKFLDGDKSG